MTVEELLTGSSVFFGQKLHYLLPIELVFVGVTSKQSLWQKVWLSGIKFPTHEEVKQRKRFHSSHSLSFYTFQVSFFCFSPFFIMFCLAFCLEVFSNLMKSIWTEASVCILLVLLCLESQEGRECQKLIYASSLAQGFFPSCVHRTDLSQKLPWLMPGLLSLPPWFSSFSCCRCVFHRISGTSSRLTPCIKFTSSILAFRKVKHEHQFVR